MSNHDLTGLQPTVLSGRTSQQASAPLKVTMHDTMAVERTPDPCGIVILGASGDLTHRKLMPALYNLFKSKLLREEFFILGVGRSPGNDASFRSDIQTALKGKGDTDGETLMGFLDHVFYHSAQYDELGTLEPVLKELSQKYSTQGKLLFHIATPPEVYESAIASLASAGLIGKQKRSAVIVEKPFGRDSASAQRLNQALLAVLPEDQIFRIDHYLGKETVQNIMMFRFANVIFEPLWNRNYIDHVQITVAESLGVEQRARYYEKAGNLRDMFQNHMFQLLATVAMEPPIVFDQEQYRNEKLKVIRSLRPFPLERLDDFIVRGQYGEGVENGNPVPAYRQEPGVNPASKTETFVAMKLFIDNWRWQDVPFYLRSGKRMTQNSTEIVVQFKSVPHSMFPNFPAEQFSPNVLSFRIQPEEGISLSFEAKLPGTKFCMTTLDMAFNYRDVFSKSTMDAYERLLLDAMLGDQTLFVREDMNDLSWEFLKPILDNWEKAPSPGFPNYSSGSWGPEAARALIQRDGRAWRI